MGLEFNELVYALEEELDMKIFEEDFTEVRTVGDLFDVLKAKTHSLKSNKCATLSAFLDIRKILSEMREPGVQRIRPQDRLHDILPAENRKSIWAKLGEQLNLHLDELSITDSSDGSLIFSFFLVSACLSSYLTYLTGGARLLNSFFFLFILLSSLGISLGLYFPLRELRGKYPPLKNAHVRDLIRLKLANDSKNETGFEPRDEERLWAFLCVTIAEIIDCDPAIIRPEADLFRDLDMG